jgi:predicted TIM-barrel fold metal-dependent hydrolase
MTEAIPFCPGPDPQPSTPKFDVPVGAVDTHAHVFGPESLYPYSSGRGYTPPDASLEDYLNLHKTLGIARGVMTQPSVYGVDNSAIFDSVKQLGDNYCALAAVGEDVSDAELERLHAARVRGVRVNLVDKGGMPFGSIDKVIEFTQRIKPLGWHLEVLIHVHDFPDLRKTLNAMAVDVVVGHLGYMKTDHGILHNGFQEFLNLIRDGKTWVKLSGSYRVTTEDATPYTDVTPFAQAIIEAGEDHTLWGTDWPHPVFWGNMPNDGVLFDQLATWAPNPGLRKKILVDNPNRLYGFNLD